MLSVSSLWVEIAAMHEGKKAQWWLRSPDRRGLSQGLHLGNKAMSSKRIKTHLHILSLTHKQTRQDASSKLIRAVLRVGRHSVGAENKKWGNMLNLQRCFCMDYVRLCQSGAHTWCLLCFGLWISRCGLCFFCLEGKDRLAETLFQQIYCGVFFLMHLSVHPQIQLYSNHLKSNLYFYLIGQYHKFASRCFTICTASNICLYTFDSDKEKLFKKNPTKNGRSFFVLGLQHKFQNAGK